MTNVKSHRIKKKIEEKTKSSKKNVRVDWSTLPLCYEAVADATDVQHNPQKNIPLRSPKSLSEHLNKISSIGLIRGVITTAKEFLVGKMLDFSKKEHNISKKRKGENVMEGNRKIKKIRSSPEFKARLEHGNKIAEAMSDILDFGGLMTDYDFYAPSLVAGRGLEIKNFFDSLPIDQREAEFDKLQEKLPPLKPR